MRRKMNSLRRRVVLGIVIFLLLITGCMGQTPVPKELSDQEIITLTFRHFWILEHDEPVKSIISDVISQFETANSNVKIDFEGIDQTFHREQKLKSEMVTGNPPDLFALFGGAEIEPYVRAQRLLDLKPFLAKNKLLEQFKNLDLWTFGEGIFGLPIEGNAEPLFYNKKIFAKLDLLPPTNISQLINTVKILRANGYIPFAFGNEERWQGAIYYHYLLDQYAGSNTIKRIAGGEGSFVNEQYKLATEVFIQLIELEAFPEEPNQKSKQYAIDLFTQGKAAMYLNGNWDINLFQDEYSSFSDDVGVIHFPNVSTNQGETHTMAGGYTFGLGLSADLSGAKRDAALELIKLIYTPEVQTRLVYEALRIPSMEIQVDPERTGPIFAQLIDLMENTERTFIPYDNILPPEVKQSFLLVVEQLFDRKLTADEALAQLQEDSERYWELTRSSYE